ncbi:MAG: signal peptide peptidase SppA [Firmicutes bacterium]|nr:signal peptide peptidase SppA [Bacillota bacterium]
MDERINEIKTAQGASQEQQAQQASVAPADCGGAQSQQASGTPYWNGLEKNPSGGYTFTGDRGQGGYAPYNVNANGGSGGSSYNDGLSSGGSYRGGSYASAASAATAKKMPGWVKGLIIFSVVCLCIIGLGAACSRAVKDVTNVGNSSQPTYNFKGDYVGVLYLEGTISDGVSGDGYSQGWILERIAQMTEDKNNRGIMLHVNTPGGSAYATSEVYKALLDYKEETGNPIYVYMGQQATSGGYYVAMAADKIYANEECWTGSIGVVVGTLYDFSELFEKYGIKATNIVSGANKDMGSYAKPLTEEQVAILQSLVDDSFGRFVKAVVDGRGLSDAAVRKLADGRIYTAAQALEGGLIDAVGSLDEALTDMVNSNGLSGVNIEAIEYVPEDNLLGLLGLLGLKSQIYGAGSYGVSGGSGVSGGIGLGSAVNAGSGDLAILMQLMEESGKVSIEFICPLRK